MAKISITALLKVATFADSVGKNKAGNYVLRFSYFYRVQAGRMELHKAAAAKALTEAGLTYEFVADGDHFAAFRGNASVAQGSHTWLEVQVAVPQPYLPIRLPER